MTILRELAEQYRINPKTVAKWKKRSFANDAPMGPKEVRSTVLTQEEEAAIVAFRKYTLLPLDDCLYCSSLYLILQTAPFWLVGLFVCCHSGSDHFRLRNGGWCQGMFASACCRNTSALDAAFPHCNF
jgi:hypothetical protein